jgi:hypothetical protein
MSAMLKLVLYHNRFMNDVLLAIMKEEEYRKLCHQVYALDLFTLKCWDILAH